jgi:hypothetical protein
LEYRADPYISNHSKMSLSDNFVKKSSQIVTNVPKKAPKKYCTKNSYKNSTGPAKIGLKDHAASFLTEARASKMP